MVQIYEDQPSFMQRLGIGLGQAIPGATKAYGEHLAEKQAAKKFQEEFGFSASPAERQEFMKQFAKAQARKELLKNFPGAFGQTSPQMGDKLAGIGQELDQPSQMTQEPDYAQLAQQAALLGDKPLQDYFLSQQKLQSKEKQFEREQTIKKEEKESAKVQQILDKVEASKETILQRRADYNIAERALKQSPNDIGSLKNFLADAFHLPGLKTASAAAFGGAMKDAYIQSIKQIPGARPNQWIEQQIQSAMARVGYTDEANQNLLDLGKFKLDIEEKYNDLIDGLSNKYINENKNIPSTISNEAYKLLKPYVEEREKELAYDMRVNFEKEQGLKELEKIKHVPKGTPLTGEMAQILLQKTEGDQEKALKLAENLGYEIPSEEFLKRRGYIVED